jgi:DinB superfamily
VDPQVLAFQFGVGAFVLERNLADVTNEESFRPPDPGGNTMNWIVGHVVRARNQALGLLGEKPPFEDEDFTAYGAGESRRGQTLSIDELKRRFDRLGPILDGALRRTSPSQLSGAAPFSPTGNPNETIGTLLASIAFHEAYHLGQTGLSRRLLGKPGALLAPGEVGHSPARV